MRERVPLMHHPDPSQPRDKWDGVPNGAATVEAPRRPGERLPRERVNHVVSGVANHELKLIVLGGMVLDPKVYDFMGAIRKYREMQNWREGWAVSNSTPYLYCTHSFAPVGLVVREEIMGDRQKIGYRPSQAGMDALPFIGHMLGFSERHKDVSLQRLLSVTSARRHDNDSDPSNLPRAPQNRVQIIRALLASNTRIKFTDLRAQSGVPELLQHVENLSLNKLVTYEPIDETEPYLRFSSRPELITDAAIEAMPRKRFGVKIVHAIASIAKEQETSLTAHEYVALLKERFPEYQQRQRLYTDVRGILTHLAKHGMMDRTETDSLARSFVSLSDPQRKLLTEFMEIIDGFEKGDEAFLKAGEQKAREILGDPERVAALAEKAWKFSKAGNTINAKEFYNEIFTLIDEKGEAGVQSSDVVVRMGTRIGRGHARVTLREMHEAGLLDRRKVGRRWIYTRASNPPPDADAETTETADRKSPSQTSELAQSTPQVVFDAGAHYQKSGTALGDLMGEGDPFGADSDVPLAQRYADRQAADFPHHTKRQGK